MRLGGHSNGKEGDMTTRTMHLCTSFLGAAILFGCSAGIPLGKNDEGATLKDQGSGGTAAAKPAGNSPAAACPPNDELIRGDWFLEPSYEEYLCVKKTLTEDADIVALRVALSDETHDVSLSVGAPAGPDGVMLCPEEPAGTQTILTVEQEAVRFAQIEAGSALRLSAGQQLTFRIHSYNVTDNPTNGNAAIQVSTAPVGGQLTPEALPLTLSGACAEP